jgi:hypothetical protein
MNIVIGDAIDLDLTVHGQVGTRARGKSAVERDFHRDRALHR